MCSQSLSKQLAPGRDSSVSKLADVELGGFGY
jgi:hypothetical protein